MEELATLQCWYLTYYIFCNESSGAGFFHCLDVTPSPSLSPSLSLVPTTTTTSLPSQSPTDECWFVEINILHDCCPRDLAWTITRTAGGNVDAIVEESSEFYPEAVKFNSTLDRACLPEGEYVLVMKDSYGDGIASPGNYNVTSYGNLIARGGGSDGFQKDETTAFSIPFSCITSAVCLNAHFPSPTSTTPYPSPSQSVPSTPWPFVPTPFPTEAELTQPAPSTPFPTETVCQVITAKAQCDQHHSGKCSWDLASQLCVDNT